MTQTTFLGQKSIFILIFFVLRPLPDRENTSLCVGSEEMTSPRVENTASRVLLPSASPRERATRLAVFPSPRFGLSSTLHIGNIYSRLKVKAKIGNNREENHAIFLD